MLSAPPGVLGSQEPRILHLPESVESSAGDEAIELAALAGLELDPWQQLVVRHGLSERADGKWAAFESAVVVPRQNGKGGILEAIELAGLFLLGCELIVHTAHRFDTSSEHFLRLAQRIENTPELSRRLKPKGIRYSHGEESITLKSGQRIRFATRAKGGRRGFTCDLLIIDEAMELSADLHGDVLPTLRARPNPQVWYAATAPDQYEHVNSLVLSRLRQRGIEAEDPRLLYAEWSYDADNPEAVKPEDAADPAVWAAANPALGIRIDPEHVDSERRSMSLRKFAVECLGVGDWPDPDEAAEQPIDLNAWQDARDEGAAIEGTPEFALDMTPDRSFVAICAAGAVKDGRVGVEVIEHKRGAGWVVDRVKRLLRRHGGNEIALDALGPASSLIAPLEQAGVKVYPLTTREYVDACATFVDAVNDGTLCHRAQIELDEAVAGAAKRTVGADAWAWSRRTAEADISPLVAATIALYRARRGERESVYEHKELLVLE